MTYQLIALDIDGTLYNQDGIISPKTKDALKLAAAQGVKIVLASGRPTEGLRRIALSLEIDLQHIYLIGSNGAKVMWAYDESVVLHQTMPIEQAKEVIRHIQKFPVSIMMTHGPTLVSEDKEGYMVHHEAFENDLSIVEVKNLAENLDFEPQKILMSAEPKVLQALKYQIAEPFLDQFDFVFSASFYFEVIQKNINKGSSLKSLAQHLGIGQESIIAFGDNHNDVEMIQFAGCGIAMGNAVDDLKEAANEVCANHNEDGIYHSLKKHLNYGPIKLIAVDMDGTFLNSNNSYNIEGFKQLIPRIQAQNIQFVVASGNQYFQLKSFFEGIYDEVMYVAENGGLIMDAQGQKLHQAIFPQASLALVKAYLQKHPHLQAVYCGAQSAYVLPDEAFYNWAKIYAHQLEMIEDFDQITETILKINIIFPPEETQMHIDALNELLQGELVAVSSGAGNLDLIVNGCNKGFGLELIGKRLGIGFEDMVCFGDGGNDAEMLQRCRYSFAMDNAPKAIKAIARYQAPSNDDDGVLRILDILIP